MAVSKANTVGYGLSENITLLGQKLGVPCKNAAMLKQSASDLKMMLFGSDEQVLSYYKNYDSAISSAKNEVASVYSYGISADEAAKADKEQAKQAKAEAKQAKAAARQQKAESLTDEKTGDIGNIKDFFEF